jgi:hypothetical protein
MTSSTAADELSSHRTRSNVRGNVVTPSVPEAALAETVADQAADRELIGA